MTQSLKEQIEASRQRILNEIMNKQKDPEISPRKRKTVKEENKELRESRAEKINPLSFSERYEESLKEELFKNSPDEDDSDENEISYDGDKFAHVKRDGLWDVLADEEIHYFDPELSYEITGYRPITETEGLDFDPLPFSAVGKLYEDTGSYTDYPPGYKSYNDFWNEQIRRCAEGYTVGNYRITGDHYFFLNFYRMQTVPKGVAGKGRFEAFPSFHAKQYEFFHYIDLCEATKKDATLLKARGLGFSEMMACLAVRPYVTTRKFRTLCTAASDQKLTPLLTKVWYQMDWLNRNTNGGMKRTRQVINNVMHKRCSRLTKDRVEFGRMSEVLGIVADTADKIRGERVDRLFFEECFAKDTKVIMSDYNRKNIQDISVGDFVMGIDGSPQEVIRICSGEDELFRVDQRKGSSYTVNSKHKLYVEHRPRVWNYKDVIKTITPKEYKDLSPYNKKTTYGLKSPGLNFNNDVNIDPYFLGLWLGDGISSSTSIVINETDDIEIKNYIVEFFSQFDGCQTTISKNNSKTKKLLQNYSLSKINGNKNTLREEFKKYNLINNKHIPKDIYFAPIEYRLKVLAGLIDTDGNLKKGSHSFSFSYEIAMSRKELIFQIGELARSCGMDVSFDNRIMKNGYKIGSESFRVKIRGDLRKIPVQVERKKLPNSYTQTTNPLSTSISVSSVGRGKYYGITLKSYDKQTDNLFLLDDYTIVHNCGSNKNLIKSWIQSNALVELGGNKWAIRVSGGTGGDSGPNLEGLSTMFSDPESYNVLPYKNCDTDDGKVQFTGFFIPAHKFSLLDEYLDDRGVTKATAFKEHYVQQRKKMSGTALLDYCAEHCFTPTEALIKQGENMFDSVALADRLTQLRIFKEGLKPKQSVLIWDRSESDDSAKVKLIDDPTLPGVRNSKLLIYEKPLKDTDGNVFRNLYVAGIDSIDQGTEDSATQRDVSDFCIVIKRRMFGLKEPKYVAIYKDRPKNVREAYEIAMKLLTYYNCKALVEHTKISIITYFKEKKKDWMFMRRPAATMSDMRKGNSNMIGAPAHENIIKHGLELITNFVDDYCYSMDIDEMLEQLLKYSYEAKRKFDIVAAMIYAEIADEDLMGWQPKEVSTNKQWVDIGYYTDSDGRRRYGQIPQKRNYGLNR